MNRESQLLDLVVEWEERRAAGEAASPESLCRECPELVDALKEHLAALQGIDATLDAPTAPPRPAWDRTEVQMTSPAAAVAIPVSGTDMLRPNLPGYEILEELGRGGMGVVLKARQTALGRTVAIKAILPQGLISQQQRQRVLREAKAMALLQHPNIVQIHEVCRQNDLPYLVMEYVSGPSLSESLAERPWPPRRAATLLAALARAVQVAHDHGVVHRDLKPGNILLAADGTPKICDFGLAREFENTDCTQTQQVAGTPSYMAPEQFLGTGDGLGPLVDVYALGAVCYETLTGRPPHLADNPLDTMQLVVNQEPVPPRQLQPHTPRDLETICLKCLAKEPHRRYATAGELAEDLERQLAGEPIRARPVGPAERTWRWCRKHPSATALLGVATVAVAVVLAIVLVYNQRLSQELARTEAAHRQVLSTRDKLHGTLARQVAERIDGDLRELAATPLAMSTLLEQHGDWEEREIERTLREMLERTPMIFGLCVAFEPRRWRADREDFALYVYRHGDRLTAKQLVGAAYQPPYRQWGWYRAAMRSPQGGWSEPYIGLGGDNTPMATFSAPIRRNGRFIGVVTADLAMDYFRELRTSMDRLDLGPRSYAFVVSSNRRILAHAEDAYEFPAPRSDLRALPLDASFRTLAERWARDRAGAARAVDFATGQWAEFHFASVPAAGWTLVVAIY